MILSLQEIYCLQNTKPMKATVKTYILFSLFLNKASVLNAQLDFSKYEIGINAGTFIYQGDLTPSRLGSYRTLKPDFNVYVNKLINPTFSLRTNFSFGTLKGDDSKYSIPEYRQQRNFLFKSPVFEVSELIVADLLKNNLTRQYSKLSPYVFAGIGFSFLNIKRDWTRFNAEYFSAETSTIQGLAADQQHSPPKLIPVIPLGGGVRYPLSKKISITAETSYRFTFTDYLDGFSKAANDSRKDSYQSHSIGLIYQFGKPSSLKCPTF
jgi:hypothetical protein